MFAADGSTNETEIVGAEVWGLCAQNDFLEREELTKEQCQSELKELNFDAGDRVRFFKRVSSSVCYSKGE